MAMLRNIYFPVRYFIALAFLLSSLNANSAINSWVNPSSSGVWNDPANWSLGTVPSATDDVTILQPVNGEVILSNSVTLNSLKISSMMKLRLDQASAEINANGLIEVDDGSEIQGVGVINANGGLNLNGTLEAESNGIVGILTLNGSSDMDLDGSDDIGRIRVAPFSNLVISATPSDPFSGAINLVQGSVLTLALMNDLVIDGEIILEEANNLTIDANSFLFSGDMDLNGGNFNVTTPSPWRMEGEIQTTEGTGGTSISGSPFIVGSGATILTNEILSINSEVILEATAKIEINRHIGGTAEVNFRNNVSLVMPDINTSLGPWLGFDAVPEPGTIRFDGNVDVRAETEIFGFDTFSTGSGNIRVDANFTLDVYDLNNRDTVSMAIKDSIFSLKIRHPEGSMWINNMNVILDNGTFDFSRAIGIGERLESGSLCHQGTFSGTGTINASLRNGTNCTGTIAPGLSAGTITVNGNVESSAMEFVMEIAGEGVADRDQFIVHGDLAISGGTLIVDFIDGYRPRYSATGVSYSLFTVTGAQSINFENVELRGLPEDDFSMDVDTSDLNSTGSIKIRFKGVCEKPRFQNSWLCTNVVPAESNRFKNFIINTLNYFNFTLSRWGL